MSEVDPREAAGRDVCRTLAGSAEGAEAMASFFGGQGPIGAVALRTGAGEVWSRTALSRRDRSMAVIAFLAALGREAELRAHLAGGLNHGLTPIEVDEILLQVGVYAGVPFALAGSLLADAVIAEREGQPQRTAPRSPLAAKSPEQRRADGLGVLKTLLGQPNLDLEATDAQIQNSQGDLGQFVMDYAFGDVWARDELSRRDRSFVVVSVLAALNLPHELAIHLRGALNHGVTQAEIEEIMITLMVYGGFPRAIDGLAAARRIFEEPA